MAPSVSRCFRSHSWRSASPQGQEPLYAPGVTTADLLVINKTDLAPMVGADLTVMSRDAAAVRNGRPVLFTSVREEPGAHAVATWVSGIVESWVRDHGHEPDHAPA